MVVIKRDGREVNFDKTKIRDAAYRALCEVDHLHPIENKENLAERLANRLAFRYKKLHRAISVEEIQDDVETELMEEGVYAVAKAYIKYRYEHELLRNASTLDGKVLSIADNVNETVIQENSNKNPAILSTQRDYIAGELSRVSAPGRFCSFSPNRKCRKMAGKGVQPLDNYTCRFCLSSLKQADKSGLDRLQAGELAGV